MNVIEHKNGDLRRVRDDIAADYVACVNCKGMGSRMLCDGQLGHLWSDGWQINSYARYWCKHCDGVGIWPVAPANPTDVGSPSND
jgi:hypothetical protein